MLEEVLILAVAHHPEHRNRDFYCSEKEPKWTIALQEKKLKIRHTEKETR